jgi:hypothetical protein
MPAPEQPDRVRLLLAGALAVGLFGVVLIVLLVGRDGNGSPAEAADARCLREWNSDQDARGFGVHLYGGHGYDRVQVTRLAPDGGPLGSNERGFCVVVFAAGALDPELDAAAQFFDGRSWAPVSALELGTPERLGALQREALAGANAALQADGRLVPL